MDGRRASAGAGVCARTMMIPVGLGAIRFLWWYTGLSIVCGLEQDDWMAGCKASKAYAKASVWMAIPLLGRSVLVAMMGDDG